MDLLSHQKQRPLVLLSSISLFVKVFVGNWVFLCVGLLNGLGFVFGKGNKPVCVYADSIVLYIELGLGLDSRFGEGIANGFDVSLGC